MQQIQEFIIQNQWVIYVLVAWTIPWKGIALWKAARNNSKVWFGILFLINTLALLDIIYIAFLSDKKKEDTMRSIPIMPQNGNKII